VDYQELEIKIAELDDNVGAVDLLTAVAAALQRDANCTEGEKDDWSVALCEHYQRIATKVAEMAVELKCHLMQDDPSL